MFAQRERNAVKLKIVIVVLSIVLVCLLACLPFVEHLKSDNQNSTSDESVASSVPASSDSTSQLPTQDLTQPTSQPATQQTSQPSTTPSADSYSDDPKVVAFIEQRMQTWICPVKDEFGEVTGSRKFATSRGGGKRAHAGLDFVAPHGTKVYAITSGTVQRVAVFYQSTWAVEVVNDDGSILRYCEIATELKAGDRVKQGDIIGTIMRADGGTEMLHMEVYYGDGEGMLTQSGNTTYKYVDDSKNYVRRSDLLDPTFLKDLPKG